MNKNQSIPGRERFSFWLDFEDRYKLETMAEFENLKLGYLIRKAVKNFIQENYARVMVEITAKEYQDKLKKADKENRTKTKKLTESQQKILRVGVNSRKSIGQQKEQRRREGYYK